MTNKKINIGIAGLAFGKEFVAVYKEHPHVGDIAICTRNPDTLKEVGDEFGIPEYLRFTNYDDMVAVKELDAIHVVTPIAEHVPQTLKALNAGKHAACTVPMATTLEDIRAIIEAKQRSGKNYMMMETSLYTREYFYVKKMKDSGELGRIQYIKGDHMQNMSLTGWGDYWKGFPPFLYGTHVLGPILDLVGTRAKSVRCLGSGKLSQDKAENYGCPYAVETATFRLENSDVVAEAHRCLFETIRQVRECFDVYGDKKSFEWEPTVDEGHTIFFGIDDYEKFEAPDTGELLPPEIEKFTKRQTIKDPNQPSFIQGAGHGGSHPHLCHEFIMSIVEDRDPYVDVFKSADITAAGICAQESAMKDGEEILVPDFRSEYK
ncbi:MAG TPA: Gfo/Idh/MocA family oxidoreductase [Anaerovoracaceae bacterium]|nr:Gfo/Idh/MocA family oxidoreductase [Anaerovoracaceae bacterium]